MLKNKLLPFLYALPVLLAFALFLSAPARYSKCVSDGISLWAVSVLPATFPFLFLTAILSRMRAFDRFSRFLAPAASGAFRVSGAGGCIFVLSAISGYPVGARAVSDAFNRGTLRKDELFRVACLCTTTGPAFLVGVVGGAMMRDVKAGWIMLAAHYIGVMLVCFILGRFGKKPEKRSLPPAPQSGNALFETLSSSVLSILFVGGAIALFSCFGQMLSDLLPLPENNGLNGVLFGLLEMTTGCARLAPLGQPIFAALCCFLVTFGGACVLMQQLAFLSPIGVKTLPFLLVKFLQGVVAGCVCFLFLLIG